MSSQIDSGQTGREELQFFGRVSASVSHEIKNVLAVINEGAGLLEDLTMMAEKGMPIAPDKLQHVARSILGQVKRGDRIVRNMNAFSHSVDQAVHAVDVDETVRLMVALCSRMAAMKNVALDVDQADSVRLCTSPYGLERLLHAAIAAGLDGGPSMAVSVRAEGDKARVTMTGGKWTDEVLESAEIAPLAEALNAETTLSADGASLTILLPGLD